MIVVAYGGSSENDDCGICGGDNSTCTDCNGDINGSAYTDGCGDCVGGNSGVEACAIDCNGIDGGTAWINECGECVDAGDTSCVQGCDGNWSNDNTELSEDDCGVCGGDNSSCTGCIDESACNYAPDATIGDDTCSYPEEDYDCLGNCIINIDCLGVCGGESQEDECGVCNGPGASVWYEDADGDGLGDGDSMIESCSSEEGYVPNDSDAEPNCATNDTDDCGVCAGGNADQDECGVCFGDGIPEGDCDCYGHTLDCAGECGGDAVEDDCGVCSGDNSSCIDCAGTPNGSAYIDECGSCVETADEDCELYCDGEYYNDAHLAL